MAKVLHPFDMNILIIQLDTLGDILRTTPLIRGLREKFGQKAKISILIEDTFLEILNLNPDLDEIITFPRPYVRVLEDRSSAIQLLFSLRKPQGITPSLNDCFLSFLRLYKKLLKEKFDLVINLHFSFRAALFLTLIPSKKQIGNCLNDKFEIIYKDITPEKEEFITKNRNLMNRLELFLVMGDVMPSSKIPIVCLDPKTEEIIEKRFSSLGIREGDFLVVIQPGVGWERGIWKGKRWPCETVANLIDECHQNFEAKVILIGTPEEKERASRVVELCRIKPINLVCKTTIAQLVAITKRAGLFVGPDSGPGHIAASLAIPTILVYGATSPLLFGPYGTNFLLLQADLPCQPIYGCRGLCPELTCLKTITSSDIILAYHFLKIVWNPLLKEEAERLFKELKRRRVNPLIPDLEEGCIKLQRTEVSRQILDKHEVMTKGSKSIDK